MARTKAFDREQALDRAMHAFWKRGYEATSLPDLLDAMGIGRQSMYDTFGDKRALFILALERYCDRANESHACLAAAASVKRAIRELFEAIVNERVADKRRGCLGIMSALDVAPHDPEVAKLLAKRQRIVEEHFYQALDRARASGEIPASKDARGLARFLVGALVGLRVAATTDPTSTGLSDIVHHTLRALE
jgi:TetR/AcrR family transcriptional repressor of nem operon